MQFRNYLLGGLRKDDLAQLLPLLTEVSLGRGQRLFDAGEPVHHVYFPSNAVLSAVTVMRDGRAVESSTIGYESATPLLAALADLPTPSRVFTQIGGSAARLPAAALRDQAAASPTLMGLLIRHAAAGAMQSEQGIACNTLHDASSRLARWILMTHDRTGAGLLPLTQDYLAIMTGVQRTTISGMASKLRDAGLITYIRGNLEVVDRAGLERCACECYGVIRDEFDKLLHPT